MDINEHLATEVMGLTVADKGCLTGGPDIYHVNGKAIRVKYWNPTENIEQAFMCLEKFESYNIEKTEGYYYILIGRFNTEKDDYDFLPEGSDIALTRAICLTIAKATGWVVV